MQPVIVCIITIKLATRWTPKALVTLHGETDVLPIMDRNRRK